MHKVEIIGTETRALTLPSTWSECTVQQLGAIAALTSIPTADDERAEVHVRLSLFRELSGMTNDEFQLIEPSDLVGLRSDELGVQQAVLIPWVDWCLKEPEFHASLLPEVTVKKRKYNGPRDRLSEWSVLQWGFCDALLRKLASSGDEQDLNNLLGALYHPSRTKWNNDEIEERGAALAHLDDRTKLAAVLNYRGLRGWLAVKYWRAFKGGKEDQHGLQGMIVRLAGPKFGSVKKARSADLHDVLTFVDQSIVEAEEAEQRMKNQSK